MNLTVLVTQMRQTAAQMVMFVLVMEAMSMRVEWRCVCMVDGGLSVMTAGTAEMLKSSVDNWDTLVKKVHGHMQIHLCLA